jgi:N-acetylmuramic acid 6-phosphate etherase
MLMEELNLTRPEASALLKKFGSVRAAIDAYRNGNGQID